MRGRTVFLSIYLIIVFTVLVAGSAMLGYLLAETVAVKQSEQFTAFNPDLPTRILDIRGDLITEFSSNEKREIIKFEQIPSALINALLVREDRSFYEHRGFTMKAIFRAVVGKLNSQNARRREYHYATNSGAFVLRPHRHEHFTKGKRTVVGGSDGTPVFKR